MNGVVMKYLQAADQDVFNAIQHELKRQQENLELIASENIVSPAVMEAMGSVMTNKYAEGYPKARWYSGCENVDIVEQLAIDRLKKIFGADHANVQAHSGSQANTAVFLAALKPGDTLMGLDLACRRVQSIRSCLRYLIQRVGVYASQGIPLGQRRGSGVNDAHKSESQPLGTHDWCGRVAGRQLRDSISICPRICRERH